MTKITEHHASPLDWRTEAEALRERNRELERLLMLQNNTLMLMHMALSLATGGFQDEAPKPETH